MTNTEFVQHYDQFEDTLLAFARKLTKRNDEARDLLQETTMKAYVHRDKFKKGTNFKGWISTIMKNTFINRYRKRRRSKVVNEPLDTFLFALENRQTVQNAGESRLTMEEIGELFEEIGERYSRPFLMFFTGYRYDEISETLELPMGTVKSRIFFARKKLKELIKEHYTSRAMFN